MVWCLLIGAGAATASAQAFPNFATDVSNATWYTITFAHNNKSAALEDKGAGQKVLTATKNGSNEAQQWAFIGTKDSFKLVSKKGNQAKMSGDRLTTAASGDDFIMVATQNSSYSGSFEILPKDNQSVGFNCYGGVGIGKEIALWDKSDNGNCLDFTDISGQGSSSSLFAIDFPEFADNTANATWHTITFVHINDQAAFEDKGAGNKVLTAQLNPTNEGQLWAFIGNEEGFKLVSKKGNQAKMEGGRLTTAADGDIFTIVETTNKTYPASLEIFSVDNPSQGLNCHQGVGIGKEIAMYDKSDNGNCLALHTTTQVTPSIKGLPVFSTDANTVWYYIQWATGGNIITSDGIGKSALQARPAPGNASEWKFVGDKDNCQIVNKNGEYIIVDGTPGADGSVKTAKTPYGPGFSLIQSTNANHSKKVEIRDNESKSCINLCRGSRLGGVFCCWTAGDQNNPVTFVELGKMAYGEFMVKGTESWTPDNNFTLWYKAPGTDWMNYGLPLGNGQLGAQVLGGVHEEEISINEKTLWRGTKDDKGASNENGFGGYQSFGNVMIRIPDDNPDFGWTDANAVSNYYRTLDMTNATATVNFTSADGTEFKREFISSYPDKVIAMHFTASKPGKLYLNFQYDPGTKISDKTTYANGYASYNGKYETVSYATTFKVVPVGGTITTDANGITVKGANEVLLILAGNTDYDPVAPSYTSGTATLVADVKALADKAAAKGWNAIYSDHVADYSPWFNRVDIAFDGASNDLPTDQLRAQYEGGAGPEKYTRAIEQMYYQYGRYLAIGSSRGVDLPNNLQGIWSGFNAHRPHSGAGVNPWMADIHANINIEMNYWPTEPANLSEMHEKFTNYIINQVTIQPQWHQNPLTRVSNPKSTKGWSIFNENNIFGAGSSWGNNYVVGNAWYCTHLIDHYRFTLDRDFLRRAMPVLWGACEFWIERLQKAADGTYEAPNEMSPEHGPNENAVAHAQQIVAELFAGTLEAIKVLGEDNCGISAQDIAILKDRYENMDRGIATEKYTGAFGESKNGVSTGDDILREWKYSPYSKGENEHRHLSHLMALYPFGQITPDSEFFTAAVNSLKLRGNYRTGWSRGWKINCWARALDGDHMHQILKNMINDMLSDNLYDQHPPFQIDGNFGATSGMSEALLQSQKCVYLLPALPSDWKTGHIHGLKARGNFTVDIDWADGKLKKATITSVKGAKLNVRYNDLLHTRIYVNGNPVEPEVYLADNTATIPADKGDVVTVEYDQAYTQPNTKEGHHPDNLSSEFTSVSDIFIDHANGGDNANFNVTVGEGTISVEGNDIAAVTVNDVVGRTIARTTGASTMKVNTQAGSVALVTVTFTDGSTRTRKVVIR